MASPGRHLPADLGLLVLGNDQDLEHDLHPAEEAPREALDPDHHLVPRVAEGKVPPQVEGGLAPVALSALGARGGGVAKLPFRREEGRRQPPRRRKGALLEVLDDEALVDVVLGDEVGLEGSHRQTALHVHTKDRKSVVCT